MTLDASRIAPLHDVRDSAKLDELAASMRADGWVGRPVLAWGDPSALVQAVTGSHRIAAAMLAEIEVPALVMEFDSEADFAEFERASDDDDRLAILRALSAPSEAIALMDAEVESNYAQQD